MLRAEAPFAGIRSAVPVPMIDTAATSVATASTNATRPTMSKEVLLDIRAPSFLFAPNRLWILDMKLIILSFPFTVSVNRSHPA
jgi:hypothetical protein